MLKKIGSGLKSFGRFLAALGHTSNQPSAPDPRQAAAKRMREAMHADRVATSGSTNTEQFYAKELAKGHQHTAKR